MADPSRDGPRRRFREDIPRRWGIGEKNPQETQGCASPPDGPQPTHEGMLSETLASGPCSPCPPGLGVQAVSTAAERGLLDRSGLLTPHANVRGALNHEQLLLYYQPIVNLGTGRPKGVEALLRWQHPRGALLGPDTFLPAVAHTALMHDITGWVLRSAAAALASWPGWTVSVNVTARDVCRHQLVEQVDDALHAAGIAPERLILELTEQAMVQNLTTATSVLGALRDRGVGVSLDDFGTGYSSLRYLRDLPLTELKIDRAFVARTPGSADDMAIVSSLVALGQAIGVTVVAEGVETREQALAVRDLGCTAAQGFLWGVPAVSEDIDPARIQLGASVALGSCTPPRPAEPQRSLGSEEGTRIQQLLDAGASLHTVAAALNRDGFRTPHQRRWSAHAVAAVIAGDSPRGNEPAEAMRPTPTRSGGAGATAPSGLERPDHRSVISPY